MHSSRSAVIAMMSWIACLLATSVHAQVEICEGRESDGETCVVSAYDTALGCATLAEGFCTLDGLGGMVCFSREDTPPVGTTVCEAKGCWCYEGLCRERGNPLYTTPCQGVELCGGGDVVCDDPHMQGLRGQRIDWSGVNGGWYSLIKDAQAGLHINVRLTAPLPDDFADRQLVTGISIMSGEHSLVVEVENPYTALTEGCPTDISPCLANGGLRTIVDGEEADDVLRFSRQALVADDEFSISASNLPVECRQFGGDKIWANMYEEMVQGERVLAGEESFEDWILSFHSMAAPEWCAKYIAENDLAGLQSTHAIFKIETSAVTVRLNAGVNHQGDGELDWDGRVLPELEFWQMDVGLDGLDIDKPTLSGILGETARPVYDANGRAILKGLEAIRGGVEDYRVAGSVGTHFPLLDKKDEGH